MTPIALRSWGTNWQAREATGSQVASRILYRIVGSMVQIVALGPRADIYERASTELSKTLRKGKTN